MRADFRHWYGVCMDDMEADELADLYSMLPSGSRTRAAMDSAASWTDSEYMQAYQIDLLQNIEYMHSDGKGRKPTPFPRPKRKAVSHMTRQQVRERIENSRWKDIEDGRL